MTRDEDRNGGWALQVLINLECPQELSTSDLEFCLSLLSPPLLSSEPLSPSPPFLPPPSLLPPSFSTSFCLITTHAFVRRYLLLVDNALKVTRAHNGILHQMASKLPLSAQNPDPPSAGSGRSAAG